MGKHRDMEGEANSDGHQHGGSPGYQSQSQVAWNSPSEEVKGHWTPKGCGPKDLPDQIYTLVLTLYYLCFTVYTLLFCPLLFTLYSLYFYYTYLLTGQDEYTRPKIGLFHINSPVRGLTCYHLHFTIYALLFMLCYLRFTIYTLQFTLYCLHFTIYTLLFTLYYLSFIAFNIIISEFYFDFLFLMTCCVFANGVLRVYL